MSDMFNNEHERIDEDVLLPPNVDDEDLDAEIDEEKLLEDIQLAIDKIDAEIEEELSFPKVTYRRGCIKFKETPTTMENPLWVSIESDGVTIPALFNPNTCSANDILKEGVLYDLVISTYHGDEKTYLSTYNVHEDDRRSRIEKLLAEPTLEELCASKLGNCPKIKVETIATVYNLENIHNDIHFVLCNDDASYMNCRLISLENEEQEAVQIKSGKRYAVSGIMTKHGLFIYEAVDAENTVENEKKADDVLHIVGDVVFEKYPDPQETTFEFYITFNDKKHRAKIDRYNTKSDTLLIDSTQYSFSCIDKGGVYSIIDYTSIGSLNRSNDEEEITRIDDKMFMLRCKEYSSKGVAVSLLFNVKITDIEAKGEKTTFSIKQGKFIYKCVLDKEMVPEHEDIKLNKSKKYIIDGVLVADKVYVKTIKESDSYSEKVASTKGSKFAKEISQLSRAEKEEVFRIMETCEKNEIIDEKQIECFTSAVGLKIKYDLLKEYYPKEVQKAIEETRNNKSLKESQKQKIFDTLINSTWGQKIEIKTEYDELKKALDARFYGQDGLKNEIIKTILSFKYKKKHTGVRILLVGAPGVGKTSMFKYAAEYAGIPFDKISLNGINTPNFLSGTPRLYENAITGALMRCIRKIGNRAVIMLDEVDKMSYGNDGNPFTSLYNLLDKDELFEDIFIESGIDVSDIIFVLTANDTLSLPTPILDRVTEISVSDYTREEKCIIARDYVVKDEMSNYEWGDKKLIWDDAIIDDIANKYTIGGGVRDIQKNINKIVRNAFHKMLREDLREFAVNKETLFELIDIIPCRRDDIKYDIAGIKSKFLFFKYEYSEDMRDTIVSLIVKYNSLNDLREKEVIRKRLVYLVNIVPDRGKCSYDITAIKKALDSSHYGMDDAKESILSYVAIKNTNSKSCPKTLWIDGPYGVGKTTIVKAIADAMNRKYIKISLNGVTRPEFIRGFETTWMNSSAGKIMSALSEAGTDKVVILLDEIDKINNKGQADPYTALLDLLDDSALFTDAFVGVPIDVSNIFFIATSNHAENVPMAIQDRMEKVELNGYTSKEKVVIASNYIAEKKIAEYGIKASVISSDVIEKFTEDYCKSYGIRDVDKAMDKVLREYVKRCQFGHKIDVIDYDFVKEILGSKPLKRGNIAEISVPGVTRALAVSGNYGTTFAVQVVENKYGKDDEITGLPKQSTLDSIKIAKLLVSNILQKEIPNIHIHFGEGGIEKDGPSAGITIFTAIYSCLTGIHINKNIGMTGEIDVMGNVWPIGGVELKLTAAENEGCTTVYVPYDNYCKLEQDGKLDDYSLDIIPVKNVNEICDSLFKEKMVK